MSAEINKIRDTAKASFVRRFNETVDKRRGRKTRERFLAEVGGRNLLSQLGRALRTQDIIAQRKISGIGADFREGFQRKPEGTRPPSVPINPFTSNPIIKEQERKGIRLTRVETIG